MTAHEAITAFLDFMRSEGVEPANAGEFMAGITSGEVVRFDCVGERRGRKNGWAKLYLDSRPAGAFGNWKLGISRRWSSGATNELTADERRALQAEWQAQKAKRDELKREAHEVAQQDALGIWQSSPLASPDHPYLVAKKIAAGGLRQQSETLLVPMFDDEGKLWNLQRIKPGGEKRFLFGGRIDGLFCLVGSFVAVQEALIGEGYATTSSAHQATGIPGIVAFNTSNLPKVARLWTDRRPDLSFIVLADDDEATAQKHLAKRGAYKNPGVEVAEAVATEIGARVAYPPRRAA